VDKPGMIASLSALISSVNVNISNMKASVTEDKKAHITFILDVTDKKQLATLTQKIAQLEGVIKIMR
jgi:GTP pyrophosphokinase